MNPTSTLGDRLFEVRGRRSRKVFAQLYGIHEQTLIRYEKNQRMPDNNFIQRVRAGEGISRDWLVYGKGEKYFSDSTGKCPTVGHLEEADHPQYIENIELEKSKASDGRTFNAELLQTLHENADLLRQNGDLRVEIERLRMDVERRDTRIAELERQLAEALKTPQSRQNLLDAGRAAAG